MSTLHRNSDPGCTHPVACSRLKLGSPTRPQGIPNAGGIGYSLDCAVVVVEGATLATFVTGTHHHDRHRRSSQHRRARHLLLGTIRSRNPRVAVLCRHDCRDLYLSNRGRSIRIIFVGSLPVVLHSCSGSTPSPSRAFPSSALSLGCYSRFRRQAPGIM